jgi:hypothetical protein
MRAANQAAAAHLCRLETPHSLKVKHVGDVMPDLLGGSFTPLFRYWRFLGVESYMKGGRGAAADRAGISGT